MGMRLEVKDAVCGYGTKMVIEKVSLSVESGEILCILGPNGVGKTTLFKSILGFLKLLGGEILLNGEDTKALSQRRLARAVGYVPQAHTPPFPFTVRDVVVMGRTAHMGMFASPSDEDFYEAERALEVLGILFLRDRVYTEISGGERQMVLIARALTQKPEILIMDEPTSNLDFGNQIKVLEQINRLSQKGLGVIMTSHFPNHVFLCSTKVVLMQSSQVITVGSADEVITEKNLKAAYGINVRITSITDEKGNRVKACIPLIS
jgi:iron complex transport system ATP-binding protein